MAMRPGVAGGPPAFPHCLQGGRAVEEVSTIQPPGMRAVAGGTYGPNSDPTPALCNLNVQFLPLEGRGTYFSAPGL